MSISPQLQEISAWHVSGQSETTSVFFLHAVFETGLSILIRLIQLLMTRRRLGKQHRDLRLQSSNQTTTPENAKLWGAAY